MRTLSCTQGTDTWHAERASRFTASEAPAMMGSSKYQTRAALLAQKHTGMTPDVSAHQQALFDRGHASEAAARILLEDDLGDLFPVTALHDTDDRLLASVDGITLDDSTLFEHKLYSEKLAAQVESGILEMHYVWQLEHQLLVTGAERVVFVCSDGTRDNWAQMEYHPVAGRRKQLLAGWAQFEIDLATYVQPSHAAVEKIIAETVEALPAPVVTVTGQLALQDNFKVFEARLRDFLDNKLIREPKTDQDFADLDGQIKAMKQAEAALDAAEGQMLAQITAVDQAKKTKDMLAKLVRDNRLMAEKLLTAEKERRKGEIVAGGIAAFKVHIDALNTRLGRPYMPTVQADFAGAVRGLKSLAGMEDKVDTELRRAQIAASQIADGIDANLKFLRENAAEYKALFADTAQLVLKPADDFQALVRGRIAEHEAAVKRHAEAAAEKAREAIRAEEQEKAEKAARAQVLAEQEAARQTEQAAATAAMEGIDEARREDSLPPIVLDALEVVATSPIADLAVSRAIETSKPANVVPLSAARAAPAPVAAPTMPPTMKLGDINALLSPISLTADGLVKLGFPHAATDKSAKLYHAHDLTNICAALHDLLDRVQAKQAA